MSESKGGGWWGRWIPHPGNVLVQAGTGGLLTGVGGLLIGAPLAAVGCGQLLGVARTPSLEAAVGAGVGAAVALVSGLVVTWAAENSFARAPSAMRSRSAALTLLAARAATALALVAGFASTLADVGRRPAAFFFVRGNALFDPGGLAATSEGADWSATSGHVDHVMHGLVPSFWLLLPALLAAFVFAPPLVRLASLPPRRVVTAWAGTTAALVLAAVVAWGLSLAGLRSLPGADVVWRGVLWTLLGSGLATAMALLAQKRLALWDHADRWRDATLTADLRLVFADGSGARQASPVFNGYTGPVVVLPTAESTGSVFRGDGAPSDGWVVVGTTAALLESVQCARAAARITVAAVALMATAPLAAWLVSSVL